MSFISTLPEGLASSLQQHMTQLPASVTYPGSESGRQTYLSRVPSLPENMYGTAQPYPQSTSLRTETSGYGYHMPSHAESLKAPSSLGQHYFVDRMMNPHPYSSLYPGFDMNAVRRKNATRETTGPLKAWLRQHKKNPYPTKGEKVMLAIGTRMTLTQVSTWFANARRRMKKDKLDEDDDDLDVDFAEKRERSGSLSSRVSQSSSEADTSKDLSDLSDIDVEDVGIRNKAVKKCVQRLFSPDIRTDHMTELSSSPESVSEHAPITYQKLPQVSYLPPVSDMVRVSSTSGGVEAVPVTETEITKQKPKIWSISEIIGSATKTIDTEVTSSLTYETPVTQYGHYSGYYSTYPDMHSNYPYTSMSETTSGKVSSIQYL